jgi:glyoxylase-like metal-dependent hydrolase (beta-lactamase superfamily II)
MLRWILNGLAVLLVLLLAAGWWFLFAGARAPATAPGLMDLSEWRALVAGDAGQGPSRVGWLEVGHAEFPSFAVQAGRFADPVQMSFGSVELSWPGRTAIIDTAVDAETLEEMSQAPESGFDPDAYSVMLDAMELASLVVVTHEHLDHVMGLARHPDPAAVAPHLGITPTQRAVLGQFARSGEVPEAYASLPLEARTQPVRLDAGLVAIPMAGHSPGSEMFYVQAADGTEYLFIGDIAWNMSNIDDLTTRPQLLNLLFFDPPEDRTRTRAQLRALHDLNQAEPGLVIVPAHDRRHVEALIAEGKLAKGFVG